LKQILSLFFNKKNKSSSNVIIILGHNIMLNKDNVEILLFRSGSRTVFLIKIILVRISLKMFEFQSIWYFYTDTVFRLCVFIIILLWSTYLQLPSLINERVHGDSITVYTKLIYTFYKENIYKRGVYTECSFWKCHYIFSCPECNSTRIRAIRPYTVYYITYSDNIL